MAKTIYHIFPLPIDVFPYTEEELKRMKKQGNPLILKALKDGVVLG